MVRWAQAFLVLTLVAALFGLGRLAVTSVGIAQTLFVSFLAVLLGTLILGIVGARKVPGPATTGQAPIRGAVGGAEPGAWASTVSQGTEP